MCTMICFLFNTKCCSFASFFYFGHLTHSKKTRIFNTFSISRDVEPMEWMVVLFLKHSSPIENMYDLPRDTMWRFHSRHKEVFYYTKYRYAYSPKLTKRCAIQWYNYPSDGYGAVDDLDGWWWTGYCFTKARMQTVNVCMKLRLECNLNP